MWFCNPVCFVDVHAKMCEFEITMRSHAFPGDGPQPNSVRRERTGDLAWWERDVERGGGSQFKGCQAAHLALLSLSLVGGGGAVEGILSDGVSAGCAVHHEDLHICGPTAAPRDLFLPVSSSVCQLGGTEDQRVLPSLGRGQLSLRSNVRSWILRWGRGLRWASWSPVSPQGDRRQGTLAPSFLQPDMPLRWKLRRLWLWWM